MTKLSVNVNKIAVLRNSRGGDVPNVLKVALDIERFGSEGITVHPRPDARHIRYSDVRDLKAAISTELNIEGNPIESFVDLVLEVKPAQVTLVPDAVDAITSNAGWDTIRNREFLTDICARFNDAGIRTSIFVDPVVEMVEGTEKILCEYFCKTREKTDPDRLFEHPDNEDFIKIYRSEREGRVINAAQLK